MLRKPAVAGHFYSASSLALADEIRRLMPQEEPAAPAVAAMAPHAGYVFSGGCAGQTIARLDIPDTVILIGPNHTGRGTAMAYAPEDAWLTPLGKVDLDRSLLERLAARLPDLEPSAAAHQQEHCLEVLVPFLQVRRPDVRLAPIVLGTQDLDRLLALGEALAAVIEHEDPRPLMLISSDMTHYESAQAAREKDEQALAALETLDPARLHQVVRRERISMCGMGPAAAVAEAARRLGVERGERVCYTNSAAVTGDEREVVAYAGMVFRA